MFLHRVMTLPFLAEDMELCVISGLLRSLNGMFAIPRCYAGYIGNYGGIGVTGRSLEDGTDSLSRNVGN
jgi:hypothetical protein